MAILISYKLYNGSTKARSMMVVFRFINALKRERKERELFGVAEADDTLMYT